jgi:hypothetical protein
LLRFPEDVLGDFETHVTFRCPDTRVDALERWGREKGAGMTHIVLGRGGTPSQPMLTLRGRTTLAEARTAAAGLAGAARLCGFLAVRVKIEAAPWHAAVPATDAEAAALGPAYYFEHHVKLLLEPGAGADELAVLAALAEPHSAHLSHNARRHRDDGHQERFVTQRCRGAGDATAARQLDELTAMLAAKRYRIASVEREFVVSDDDETLDHGWIEEKRDRM